jgi:hypothetical protein
LLYVSIVQSTPTYYELLYQSKPYYQDWTAGTTGQLNETSNFIQVWAGIRHVPFFITFSMACIIVSILGKCSRLFFWRLNLYTIKCCIWLGLVGLLDLFSRLISLSGLLTHFLLLIGPYSLLACLLFVLACFPSLLYSFLFGCKVLIYHICSKWFSRLCIIITIRFVNV